MQHAASSGPSEARAAIERFLKSSRHPALLEPGEEPIALEPANYVLDCRGERRRLAR